MLLDVCIYCRALCFVDKRSSNGLNEVFLSLEN